MLQPLLELWNSFDTRRRIIVVASVIAVFVSVLAVSKIATRPSMALLYAGLEPGVSGQVIGALEKYDVAFKVSGDAIYVDASQRDLLRVQLAEQGLPKSGSGGYELLDTLTGFGTTSQMFDATYWRAKEGELARTILAWPHINSARVHIANPASKPFARATEPAASVTISGGPISYEQAGALRFLVASAVAGMSPENVSVIDRERGLISFDGPGGLSGGARDKRASDLKQNVERLLAARVGPNNAVVEVTIDAITDHETIVEHRFDPDTRVAISTDTQEVSGNSTDSAALGVTVASNLPDGDAAAGGEKSKSASTETRERINYEVSETTREVVRQPGKIARISVAVLVNGFLQPDSAGGQSWAPRPEAELNSLRELVETAVGYNQERGDTVTIRSLQFLAPVEQGALAQASAFDFLEINALTLIQLAVLSLLALGMGMFVLKPILTQPPLMALPEPDGPLEYGQMAQIEGATAPDIVDAVPLDPVAQLRQLISERQDETVEVLRNWIDSSEENA